MHTHIDRSTFLRRSLQLDGVASGVCGAVLFLGAHPISTLFGLAAPGVARITGGLLVVYAAALLWNASRSTVSRATRFSPSRSTSRGSSAVSWWWWTAP